jgi:hypothetical protein
MAHAPSGVLDVACVGVPDETGVMLLIVRAVVGFEERCDVAPVVGVVVTLGCAVGRVVVWVVVVVVGVTVVVDDPVWARVKMRYPTDSTTTTPSNHVVNF